MDSGFRDTNSPGAAHLVLKIAGGWEAEVVILTCHFFKNFDYRYSTRYSIPLSTMSNISHNFIRIFIKIYPLINGLID